MDQHASDLPYIPYHEAVHTLGQLMYGNDYKYNLDAESRWVIRQTVKKTDPKLKVLKAEGKVHPALLRPHPLITPERIRRALIEKAVRDDKFARIETWLDRQKVTYREVEDKGQVLRAEFEAALARVYKKKWEQLQSSQGRTAGSEPARKGAPPKYSWKNAIAAVALAASRQLPKNQAEVETKLAEWFGERGQEPSPSLIREHAKLLHDEIVEFCAARATEKN